MNIYKENFERVYKEQNTLEKKMIMEIEVIKERDGFVLQRSTNRTTGKSHYKLFWDGECLSTVYNEKDALNLFRDFTPEPRKKRGAA